MTNKIDHISVCVCTYKRPVMLSRLLQHLDVQKTEGVFTYSVVVVDNDKEASASDVVERYKTAAGKQIEYDVEPEQNIALARNKAVEHAKGEYVAFIDDDEYPGDAWLMTMYLSMKKFAADGVLGPVRPHYETKPPEWIVRGRFYEKGFLQTGVVLQWVQTRTSNVLMKNLFLQDGYSFRAEYASGGEDKDLFRRMMEQGRTFIWCDDAPVYETIPAARCTRTFFLRRALMRGQAAIKTAIGMREIIKSVIAVPLYSLLLPFLLFAGHHRFMKYAEKDAEHIGRLLGLMHITVIKENYVMCTDIQ